MKTKSEQPIIVVTGGAGFIGSAVIRHLNDQGNDNIVVIDHLGKDEKWKNLVGKRILDIIEPVHFFDWLKGRENEIDSFIHLGACSSTVETDASYLLENNYRFSRRLAEYALNNGQRFIYASSAATYGDGSQGFSDDHDCMESLQPLNMYGFSKQLFDLWLKQTNTLDKVVGLKYFNVFGPNEYHKGRMASALLHMLPQAQQKGFVQLFKSSEPEKYADGGQMRDFIYVKDVARMTCAFLDNDANGIFNIGRGEPGTWNEIIEAMFHAIEKKPNIKYVDMPEDLRGKYQNYTCADMKKTHKALGNSAKTMELAPAVTDYIQNYMLEGKYW